MARGPDENYATVGHIRARFLVTWPTFSICDPLHILEMAIVIESNACSVCSAFDVAFTKLHWPLACQTYKKHICFRSREKVRMSNYNFCQTYTWIDSQQNNAYRPTTHSTYCAFLHLPCRNNIVRFLCCLKMKWNTGSRLLSWDGELGVILWRKMWR